MRNQPPLRINLRHVLTTVGLLLTVIYLLGFSSSRSTISHASTAEIAPPFVENNEIPKATKPCSPDVAQWWQELREAGKAAAQATARKEAAIKKAIVSKWTRYEHVPDDEREILQADELNKLNEAISISKTKYQSLIHQATEKSYLAPIDDSRVTILHFNEPRYTDEARMLKITGTIKTRVLFQGDGTVGRVTIREGLGHGLDERAIQTIYDLVFFPAVKSGQFVAFIQPVEVEFKLR